MVIYSMLLYADVAQSYEPLVPLFPFDFLLCGWSIVVAGSLYVCCVAFLCCVFDFYVGGGLLVCFCLVLLLFYLTYFRTLVIPAGTRI